MTDMDGFRKIGDLARETGVTVRTLHHYDRLGLLTPSSRTHSGHRCYDAEDVRRLHRVIALRGFGLSLREVAAVLDAEPDYDLSDLVRRQLDVVEARIRQAVDLRRRLLGVLDALARTDGPSTQEFLRLIEEMTAMTEPLTVEQVASLVEARRRAVEGIGEDGLERLLRAREDRVAALDDDAVRRLREAQRALTLPAEVESDESDD